MYVIISLPCQRRNVLLLIFLHTFPPGFLLALYSRAVLHQLIKGFLNANLLAFWSNSKEEILVCYFRTAKSLNSSLVIVLSFLNSHLSILDFGLPVSFNHLFLENKHETTKHLLITTTTKNIHLWNCQIAKQSKKFETSLCKKTSIQSSSSLSSLPSTKSSLSSSSPSLTSSSSSLFPA